MRNLIIVGVIFILNSCVKPSETALTETSPGVKVIDKTITNSMYFKPGSYWIYESDKGEIDSMWVDSKSSIGFNGDNKSQIFFTYLYSSIEQNSREINVRYWNPNQPDTQFRISILSYFRGSSSGLINADIYRPVKGSSAPICQTCTGDTAILMPTYILNGKEYKNVWRFSDKNPVNLNNDNAGGYYFAENIGLIRKYEAYHQFELIRYHIEK